MKNLIKNKRYKEFIFIVLIIISILILGLFSTIAVLNSKNNDNFTFVFGILVIITFSISFYYAMQSMITQNPCFKMETDFIVTNNSGKINIK